MGGPSRLIVLIADIGNFLAGITLLCGFGLVAYFVTIQGELPSPQTLDIIIAFMTAEGVSYAIAGAAMVRINTVNNNAYGAVSPTIITLGGIFFAISGKGNPANIISLRYLIPHEEQFLPDMAHPNFPDAAPYYGIACFMVATSMGLHSMWPLRRSRFVSPFWGVAMFFVGAWIIGIFSLYGPVIVNGGRSYAEVCGGEAMPSSSCTDFFALPTFALGSESMWSFKHVFAVLGALCLLTGAVIFCILDSVFSCGVRGDDDDHGLTEAS